VCTEACEVRQTFSSVANIEKTWKSEKLNKLNNNFFDNIYQHQIARIYHSKNKLNHFFVISEPFMHCLSITINALTKAIEAHLKICGLFKHI